MLKSLVGRVYYSLEMKAVAERAKMDLGRLVLLQHIYEASACCTSVVLDSENGPIHIRCMDWEMDILEPLTIEIDCRKGGQTVFMATTWAGFMGVFTGMRPGQWSVSLNFRVTKDGSFWSNVKSAALGSWPTGFLIRHLLESEPDFDKAVDRMATTPLVAPCYLTIAGALPGQGALITRNSKSEEYRWLLSELGTIVQCNIDHWSFEESENVMDSIRRRETAQGLLERPPKVITHDWLWSILSSSPIYNDITIYGTLMIPKEKKIVTRIPKGRRGFKARPFDPECPPHLVQVPENATYDEYVAQITKAPPASFICVVCTTEFGPYDNPKGECSHAGKWHSTYEDCNYAKCGWGLGPSNIGKRHWSCCFSLVETSATCKSSSRHTVPPPEVEDTDSMDLDEE
jgi:N-acylethanolamine-hydrolysing acid amidase